MKVIHLSIKDSTRRSSKKLHQFGKELPDIRQIEGLPQALYAELGLRLQATKSGLAETGNGRNLHFSKFSIDIHTICKNWRAKEQGYI